MRNLLVLSSDTGEGHNSAAAAIGYAGRAAGLKVLVRKPLEESGSLNRSLGNLYNVLLRHRPQWISVYFSLIDRLRPNEREAFYIKARPFIERLIESADCEAVLSVHPMLNHFIQRFVKESGRGMPCYTFVTDPFPPFWRGWASPYVDRYFVVTDEALQALTAMGVETWRIERVPMPVRPRFVPGKVSDIEDVRRILKLTESSTVLIHGGARGGGPLFEVYETVVTVAHTSNVLVVCGRNSALRWQIERLNDPRTRVFGFLDDIERYVAASDLVITKPGAMSTYESLACGVPVALIGIGGPMPQESGLFKAAAKYDFGYAAETLDDLKRILRLGPHAWMGKRESLSHFYQSSSGEELIERIQSAHVPA